MDSVLTVDSSAARQIEQMNSSSNSQAALVSTFSEVADSIIAKFNQQANTAVQFLNSNSLKIYASRFPEVSVSPVTTALRSDEAEPASDLARMAFGSFSASSSLSMHSAMMSRSIPLTLKQQTQRGLRKIDLDKNRRSGKQHYLEDLHFVRPPKVRQFESS